MRRSPILRALTPRIDSFLFALCGAILLTAARSGYAQKPKAAGKVARAKVVSTAAVATGDDVSLTLYNQNFAVVRHPLRINLKKGENHLLFGNVTALLETDSVVLRDPKGKRAFRIQEQSYRNDTASVDRLLPRFEGKTLQFLVPPNLGVSPESVRPQIVTGKLIRAGTTVTSFNGGFGGGLGGYSSNSSIVEVDGKLRFGLPGTPMFPRTSLDGVLLTPTLEWTLLTDLAGPLNAELAYVSGGFSWQASYNLVAPEQGDIIDFVGWVTMRNDSGRTFKNARIQLVAGDVRKIQPDRNFSNGGFGGGGGLGGGGFGAPPVTEKSFDEYHLYSLRSPATLLDREQKQVEFARGAGVASKRLYVYDGEQTDPSHYDWRSYTYSNREPDYETQRNTKVWVMREFANTAANGLGIPLPRGKMRLYRREDETGALQFVGEALIGHTPKNETIRLYTGDAFDIVGERRAVEVTGSRGDRDGLRRETWEIKLRNRKTTPVEVRVVEHMHPWDPYLAPWKIVKNSDPWTKMNAYTVEFRVEVKPDEEKVVTYTVEY